ncbi:MAG: hypothetical protein MUO62_17970, partial [Anaerolineales bacterium]|nr:hypothetical protein [Anaerolineales bacterium]
MKRRILNIFILFLLFLSFPGNALAQDYYFRLDKETVHVLWNDDGSLSLDYTLVFYNDPSGHAIEFVDLGLPNYSYIESSINADVNGQAAAYISSSDYEGSGSGVAIALGNRSIPSGQTGTVHIWVGTIQDVLFIEDTDNTYASAVFIPSYFGSSYVYGNTDLTVIYHLPPGVQPDEPRWHEAPSGFPEEPITGIDDQGRITYTWHNPSADGHSRYKFGASFPASYVPSNVIAAPTIYDRTGIDEDTVMGFLCCGSVGGFIVLIAWFGIANERRRKMKYLPPKIRIEGHGIKRGLTAVEAAILMEQPMDKVLTMILFSLVKKEAATVISRDPLKLEVSDPLPEGLRSYENSFLEAFQEKKALERRKKLQNLMVTLIRSVANKMKGFSHKETVAYYKKIMERAWQQVESADTPEIKSQKFDEHMGWTMLDKDFNDRTQDVFRTGPVFIPMWWPRYDPGWSSTVKSIPKVSSSQTGSGGGGIPSLSMPTLPGSSFAASVVTGIQGFSSDVVGNISDFTNGITTKTNPIPKSSSTRSSGRSSGGSSCACACACAGCACACAG